MILNIVNLGRFLVARGVNRVRLIDEKVSIGKKKARKANIERKEGKEAKK